MDNLSFIMAIEDGSMTEEDFFENVQDFVDGGTWKHLQGSWQRMVHGWAEAGHCTLKK
jgi:hypothetical protein